MYIFNKEKLPVPVLHGHEDLIELYYKAWETAFKNIEYIEKDGWKPQMTCMQGSGVIWQWDSCFMTFMTNYANGTVSAFNNLDNLYRLQRKSDGYMSMAYNIESEKEEYGERINPPLLAWAEWEHYKVTGDKSRFERVFPALEGLYGFIEKNRRRNCGLYRFEDPGSSGMDNSPRGGYFSTYLDGNDICFIDLACQQALSAKCLSKIAAALGNREKEKFYADEHLRICALINKYHWSEKAGWYFDFFARSDASKTVKFINSKTAATFWTIISECAFGKRLEEVISHLFNENEFYTKVPFASLSKEDPNYVESGGYWLGGVWPPTNYALIRGLAERGYEGLAHNAAVKLLDAMSDVSKNAEYGGIWEAYAPEEHKPATKEDGGLVRREFVGWGGLPPVAMLIENVIGLNFNAAENEIKFNVFPDTYGGLGNFEFCGGKVSVECVRYSSEQKMCEICIETEKEVTLAVKTEYLGETKKTVVPKGIHRICV